MTPTRGRVIVAEDNAALANVVRFNLEKAGFTVTLARNGREAWELLQAETFDLLVTDHQMPEMSGLEVCERLRERPFLAALPIIMLTAKGIELDQRRIHETIHPCEIMAKPFSPRELVTVVERCLGLPQSTASTAPE